MWEMRKKTERNENRVFGGCLALFGAVRKCSSHARTIDAEVVEGEGAAQSLVAVPRVSEAAAGRSCNGLALVLGTSIDNGDIGGHSDEWEVRCLCGCILPRLSRLV